MSTAHGPLRTSLLNPLALPLLALATLLLMSACAAPSGTQRTDGAELAARERTNPAPQVDDRAGDRTSVRDDGVLRFAVVADLNGRYGSTEYDPDVHRAIDRIVALRPDLVLSAGDMVAGQKTGLDYPAMWAAFHDAVSEPLARAGIPLAVTPGNHDASAYPKFAPEREQYAIEWLARKPDLAFIDDEFYPFRYAFEHQGVLFVALDITTSKPVGDEQLRWLDGLLAEHAPRFETKIVFGHVPMFQLVGDKKGHEHTADERLEATLNRHAVTMFISGHHHAYFPGRRGELRLLGVGCLGGGARSLVGTEAPPVRTLVMVEIDKYGVRSVEALAGPHYLEPLPRTALPERLVGFNEAHALLRDDIGEPQFLVARREKMAADGLTEVAALSPSQIATGLDVVASASAALRASANAARLESESAILLAAASPTDEAPIASDADDAPLTQPLASAPRAALLPEGEPQLGTRAVVGVPDEALAPALVSPSTPTPALRVLERRAPALPAAAAAAR